MNNIYTKKDFKNDLFFILGYFQNAVAKDKGINKERVYKFEKYCYQHYGDKK